MSRPGAPSGSTPVDLPGGTLEELDGTPIGAGVAVPAARAVPWRRAAVAAARLVAERPPLWAYGLVVFLARGGVVVLALPILVLPTFIGIANVVGPASVSAAGPSPRLVALIAAGIAAVGALVLVGTLVAAAAETALHRATVAPGPPGSAGAAAEVSALDQEPGPSFLALEPRGRPGRAVVRVAGLRLLLLAPVVAVTALAVPAWIAAGYRELTLPSDVAVPLALRVVAGAPGASAAVFLAWLAAEVVGGFATRRVVLLDVSLLRSLAGGAGDPVRAPVGTALTVALALLLSVVMLAPAAWAMGAAWDAARRALVGQVDAVAALAVAVALAAAWAVALLLAGIAAAGRATLMTAELLRRRPRPGASSPAGGSGSVTRRHDRPSDEHPAG